MHRHDDAGAERHRDVPGDADHPDDADDPHHADDADDADDADGHSLQENPKLSLTITPNQATIPAGGVLDVRLRPRDLGPGDAKNVVVCAPIPAGFTLVSAPGGTRSGSQVCWKVGTLTKGAKPTLKMRLRAKSRTTPLRVTLRGTADASNASKVHATALRGGTRRVLITARPRAVTPRFTG